MPMLLMPATIWLERIEAGLEIGLKTGLTRSAAAAAEEEAVPECAEPHTGVSATRANPQFRPTPQANRV
jgi:hypothetical protein